MAIYNLFPVAPPRLAIGLRYEGHPFRFVDTVFVGGGVNLSFDQYAAMPSLHVAWAVIAGVTVARIDGPVAVRLLAMVYPLLIGWAVIVTGNHFIADCLGGAGIVLVAYCLALRLSYWWRRIAIAGTRW